MLIDTIGTRRQVHDSQYLGVVFDPEDDGAPIGVLTDEAKSNGGYTEWLSRDDAVDAASAILGALNGSAGNVTLASSVTFNEGLLRLAAVHGKTVTFRYAKGDGSVIETRSLIPAEVKQVGDHLTFIGHDPDRDEPRAYRVDRMKGEVSVA